MVVEFRILMLPSRRSAATRNVPLEFMKRWCDSLDPLIARSFLRGGAIRCDFRWKCGFRQPGFEIHLARFSSFRSQSGQFT
jgi:hypothetical protein